MEASATTRALQEPAILYLILRQLPQDQLLCVQRVCQTWNILLSTDTRLQAIMWLHPGISSPASTRVEEATTQINPLLQRTFPSIFDTCEFWDGFTTIPDRCSPCMDMWLAKPPEWLEVLKYPTASWRRMLPCFPPPDQLLVHVPGEEEGKVMRLNFSNRNDVQEKMQPSRHPPWLTFGMLYDIVECAWFQANPWRLHCVRLNFPSASLKDRPHQQWVPPDAIISNELRAAAKSRAGLVRVQLEPDTRSEAERWKVHEETVAQIARNLKKVARWGFCGNARRGFGRIEHFTDEFHFGDALSLEEIEWDGVDEYVVPMSEADPAEPPRPSPPTRRSFLGRMLGRRG